MMRKRTRRHSEAIYNTRHILILSCKEPQRQQSDCCARCPTAAASSNIHFSSKIHIHIVKPGTYPGRPLTTTTVCTQPTLKPRGILSTPHPRVSG